MNVVYGMKRGEVVDNLDPYEAGRVKINVFGVYDDIPIDDLPWALYSDPFMGGDQDIGGFYVPDVGSHVWVFFEEGDPEQPVYFAGAPARDDGPTERRTKGQYPQNRVFKTKAGHMVEIDDTPGDTRIRVSHMSGSQKIWIDNGDVEEQIVGKVTVIVEQDANIHVKGNVTEYVDGDVIRQVKGSLKESVMGDYTTHIQGRRKEISGAGAEYLSTGQMDVSGSRVDLNKKKGASVEVVDGEFMYTLNYAYSYGAARELVKTAGTNAPFDTPEDADVKAENTASGEFPEEDGVDESGSEEMETQDEVVQQIEAGCPVLEDDVYKTPIGNRGMTVRSLTLGPIFKHQIQAQNGLSVEDIVCNMHHLCVNAIDPLMEAFPNLRINSGFRRGSSKSQHNKGMAVDLSVHDAPSSVYKDILDFIAANIPYDQCIIETTGKRTPSGHISYWVHVSYDRTKSSQRKSRLTYRNNKYTSGWSIV